MKQPTERMDVWSRHVLTNEHGAYRVVSSDDAFSFAEVTLAKLRLHMWPAAGAYRGRAEMADMLSRGLVETCHCNRIDPLAYPEGL